MNVLHLPPTEKEMELLLRASTAKKVTFRSSASPRRQTEGSWHILDSAWIIAGSLSLRLWSDLIYHRQMELQRFLIEQDANNAEPFGALTELVEFSPAGDSQELLLALKVSSIEPYPHPNPAFEVQVRWFCGFVLNFGSGECLAVRSCPGTPNALAFTTDREAAKNFLDEVAEVEMRVTRETVK
jgi:hypothetical protein